MSKPKAALLDFLYYTTVVGVGASTGIFISRKDFCPIDMCENPQEQEMIPGKEATTSSSSSEVLSPPNSIKNTKLAKINHKAEKILKALNPGSIGRSTSTASKKTSCTAPEQEAQRDSERVVPEEEWLEGLEQYYVNSLEHGRRRKHWEKKYAQRTPPEHEAWRDSERKKPDEEWLDGLEQVYVNSLEHGRRREVWEKKYRLPG